MNHKGYFRSLSPLHWWSNTTELVDFKKLRGVINEHISIAVGEIEEAESRITFAIREKVNYSPAMGREVWRVNVQYTPKSQKEGSVSFSRNALYMIDAITENVLEFKEGRYWNR